jgi:hypothetical protein
MFYILAGQIELVSFPRIKIRVTIISDIIFINGAPGALINLKCGKNECYCHKKINQNVPFHSVFFQRRKPDEQYYSDD